MVGIFFEEARPGELKANLIIMWREDNIIEEIVEDSNIEDAIKTVLRKRRRKRSFAGRRILADVPKAVERIRQRIRSGRFKLGGYREMTVDDGPKVRTVQSVSLEDRIVLNAVMNVVDRHLKVRFIRTTSASLKNRGTHDLLQYIVKDIKDDPEGTLSLIHILAALLADINARIGSEDGSQSEDGSLWGKLKSLSRILAVVPRT